MMLDLDSDSGTALAIVSGVCLLAAYLALFLLERSRDRFFAGLGFTFLSSLVANLALLWSKGLTSTSSPWAFTNISINAAALMIPIFVGASAYLISTAYKVLLTRLMLIPVLSVISHVLLTLINPKYFRTSMVPSVATIVFLGNILSFIPNTDSHRLAVGHAICAAVIVLELLTYRPTIYLIILSPSIIASLASLVNSSYGEALEILFGSALGCACVNPQFLLGVVSIGSIACIIFLFFFPSPQQHKYALMICVVLLLTTVRLQAVDEYPVVTLFGRKLGVGVIVSLVMTMLARPVDKTSSLGALCVYLVSEVCLTRLSPLLVETRMHWIPLAIISFGVGVSFFIRWKVGCLTLLVTWSVAMVVHSVKVDTMSIQMVSALVAGLVSYFQPPRQVYFAIATAYTLALVNVNLHIQSYLAIEDHIVSFVALILPLLTAPWIILSQDHPVGPGEVDERLIATNP